MACFDLANHPPADTIRMLTGLLDRITKTNDRLEAEGSSPSQNTAYTAFHARSIPTIDIHSYLSRILKYCPCKNECFLSLLVYFDRMSRRPSGLRIDSYNIHRLLISGIMVSSKFFSDVFFTNTRYAKVGGLPVTELNQLELEFLQLNEFNLYVSTETLQQYGDQLLMHWVREEGKKETERRHSGCNMQGDVATDHKSNRRTEPIINDSRIGFYNRNSKFRHSQSTERLSTPTSLLNHHRLLIPPYPANETLASTH